jgi:type II secretory ATPase GspE/PulE/Tfp pilus assembly ATPase PilB-like protein/CheY-like chemotaxis protein
MMMFLVTAARRAKLPGADALAVLPGTPVAESWTEVARLTGTTPESLAEHVARSLKLGVADLSAIEPKALRLLPEKLARRYHVVPLRETDRHITVATANPDDLDVEQAVSFAAGRSVIFEIAPPAAIAEALDATYAKPEDVNTVLDRVVGTMDTELADAVKVVDNMQPEEIAEREAESEPVVKLTSLILRDGIVHGASDLHVEPGQKGTGVVRFRVDGVMRQHLQLPMSALNRVVSRIKVLAKLDIADRMRPQDGRARVQIEGKTFDLRVSTVPTRESEKAVIRVLRSDNARKLDDMGIANHELSRIRQLLSHHEGIVVVTGPTGSGKTTTLYAALKEIANGEVNVITVEDPVEYELPGITQIQVETKRGVTFASALRAVLRQDPDVIFVGEIRDTETAQIAVQAAMTGHLVLATLHTNDATGAVSRLADLGLDRPSISATLRGALAQRLVRRLCPQCAAAATAPLPEPEASLSARSGVTPGKRAVGCSGCGGTGYRGRVPVLEVFTSTPPLAAAIAKGASVLELQDAAITSGMRLLRQTALEKVAQGVTTLSEVDRVIGIGEGAKPGSAPESMPAPESAPVPGPDSAPEARTTQRVLIVDDDPVQRALARAMLEQCGLTVSIADDGDKAQAMFDSGKETYQLVVTDLCMPTMNGDALLTHIRRKAGPPVIVLTGSEDGAAEARLIELGADDYVRKPYDPPRFIARVKAALRRAAM